MSDASKSRLRKANRARKLRALVDLADDAERSPPNKRPKSDTDGEGADDESYDALRARATAIERRRRPPKLRLKTAGVQASLSTHGDDRVPILLTDVQRLLADGAPSRWFAIEKRSRIARTVVLVVDGLSVYDACCRRSELPATDGFEHRLEVVTPRLYGGCVVDELAAAPLPDDDDDDHERRPIETDGVMVMMRCVFPVVGGERPPQPPLPSGDRFSRTRLVLSAAQLVEENYPVPVSGKPRSAYSEYSTTRDSYAPVTAASPMFGLDCEMCRTSVAFELARATLVDEDYRVVYDAYVRPRNKILDYMTRFSGITAETLENVDTTLDDVRDALRSALPPDAILVGQSLNFDLHALKAMHPYVIDTSVIYNTTGDRSRKTKLKQLAKQFLGETIQGGDGGHCSREDAVASLKLVRLKLSNGPAFGDAVLRASSGRRAPQRDHLRTEAKRGATSALGACRVVAPPELARRYGEYARRSGATVASETDGSAVVERLLEESKLHALALGHVDVGDARVYDEANRWIDAVRCRAERDALVAVLFSGTEKCNGALFVGIKK